MAANEEPLLCDTSLELTEAVQLKQWDVVVRLVRSPECSDEIRQWAIEKVAENVEEEDIVCGIIDLCAGEPVVNVFSLLIKRGLWETVYTIMCSGKCSEEMCTRAVHQVATHGDDDVRISQIVIPYCSAEQVDFVLSHLIRRGMWGAVRDLMKSGKCSDEQSHWALEEMVKYAADNVVCDVIHLHATDQTDFVWSHLIRRGLGNAVYSLMESSQCSDEQRCKAVDIAVKSADEHRLRLIIEHCPADQVESVLSHLISRGLYGAVNDLIENSNCSEEQRCGAIEEAAKEADDKNMSRIIEHCASDQIDTVLYLLIKRKLWRSVYKLMKSSKCTEEQRRVAITQVKYITCYHFGVGNMEKVFSNLMKRGLWIPVAILLGSTNCSDDLRCLVIEKLTKQAPEGIVYDVIDQCPADRIDSVLSYLITRHMWEAVGKVLKRNISSVQHMRAVEEASQHAGGDHFVEYILPHCTYAELEQAERSLWSRNLHDATREVLYRRLFRSDYVMGAFEASQIDEYCNFLFTLPTYSDGKLDQMLTHLMSRDRWRAAGKVLKRGVSDTQRMLTVKEASQRANDSDFVLYILPHCVDEELEQVFTHLVSRGVWKTVGGVLKRGISGTQHRRAVEESSQHAHEDDFVDYILPHCVGDEFEQVITHLAARGLWRAMREVLKRITGSQRMRAIEEASQHADDYQFSALILHHCVNEELERVLINLVSRHLWVSVGEVLKRGIDSTLHKTLIEKASQYASWTYFIANILPHCSNKDSELVITHLVSRGLWEAVDKVLKRGISGAHHRWAVVEASKNAENYSFAESILPHCADDQLEEVLTHLVSRGQWKAVSEVLKRDISGTCRRWVIEEVGKHADCDGFNVHILHTCTEEDLEQVIPYLVSRGLWKAVGRVLRRGVSDTQYLRAVEEASEHADDNDFVEHISLPHCVDEELHQVVTHLVKRGLWKGLGRVLKHGVSGLLHNKAVEEASQLADGNDFIEFILPHCLGEDLDHVITHLVSRHLWRAVGRVLNRGVSAIHHRRTLEEASRSADDGVLTEYILPYCVDEDLEWIMTQLLSRGLWRDVGTVLERGVSGTKHRAAVEEASQNADVREFVEYILPHCLDEDLEHVITHLMTRGLWEAVGGVLKRGIGDTRRKEAVEKANILADDDDFERYILCHCSADELVTVLPRLVANGYCDSVGQVLRDAVCDTLMMWVTSKKETGTQKALLWTLFRKCRVGVSWALRLYKAVTQDTKFSAYDLARRLNRAEGQDTASSAVGSVGRPSKRWNRVLCEVLFTSLSHAVCYVICSDDKEYRDSWQETRQSVAAIYRELTSCIQDNLNCVGDVRLGIIRNKEKWTSVFTDLATIHQTDPLFFLHFLRYLNLYQGSRRGEDSDIVLLTLFAVLPLFPKLQSVALRIMLRENRWDIISQACLTHAWEHDRRCLFKAAVEQSEWNVVKVWADHRLQEDQRFWALGEAFKEKQWEAYLLLADHGLTHTQLMGVHYVVAKYGNWRTVLQMCERGGDVAEIMWKLMNSSKDPWKLKYRRLDDVELEYRIEQLQELKRDLIEASSRYSRKALECSNWCIVLFKINQGHLEYIVPAMQKAQETGAWHVLMHLVRLGMAGSDRDMLYPKMVKQQQWGVCCKLLEYGISDHLCREALPHLIKKNQWFLVGLAMKYDMDNYTIRHVMECAFQRREGAVFWQCLSLVEDNPLSEERRKMLFYKAISRDIWEIIKQLMATYDCARREQRDVALLEALEQHLWDVVDECQLHGADINVKDENNETALHRELRNRDWRAVRKIVYHDGEPNLLDKYQYSVLNRLINHEQWQTLEFVIKYGADVHFPARMGYMSRDRITEAEIDKGKYRGKRSPLQGLIDDCQEESIKFTLMWCPDQWIGVNSVGETALHLACLTEQSRKNVHYLLARKVDPLAVTEDGLSALAYAVLGDCPAVMVATCIRFGFSTHQPSLTILPDKFDIDTVHHLSFYDAISLRKRRYYLPTSPLLLAMCRPQRDDIDTREVIYMLYESGTCNHKELFQLHTTLSRMISFLGTFVHYQQLLIDFRSRVNPYLVFLKEAASTPRSLKSLCRLIISHCIGLRGRLDQRHVKVSSLRLTDELQNYVLFKDLWYGLCLE